MQDEPNGALKGMILSALLTGEKTSNSIFEEVTDNEYEFNMYDGNIHKFTYEGSMNNLRVDILYLRKHKYIRIVNDAVPYIYGLTQLGKAGAEAPFKYLEYREKAIEKALKVRAEELKAGYDYEISALIQKMKDENSGILTERAKEIANAALNNEKKFREAVDEKVKQVLMEQN